MICSLTEFNRARAILIDKEAAPAIADFCRKRFRTMANPCKTCRYRNEKLIDYQAGCIFTELPSAWSGIDR